MTKPEDGRKSPFEQAEELLGAVPEPPAEYEVPSDEDDWNARPARPWKPPHEFHDAEDRLPPPISGSTE
ncbi:hypothetical protein JNUCC0626_29090 [Lentzea sp. JNUCC 0626]|uniref:hypothetical protein n=1 Tax=Lentzea sp. JNUCC 0626 TaxID=3367513 RepID=UPI00374866DF